VEYLSLPHDEIADILDNMGTDNMASIEETREKYFDEWDTAMGSGDYRECDRLKDMILYTMQKGSESRNELEAYVAEIDNKYHDDIVKLEEALHSETDPFNKEKMKQVLPEEEAWRTKNSTVCSPMNKGRQ